MPQSTANLKALGLNYGPNQLSTPDGSLIQADNVVIRRDNVLESRRGYRRYSQPVGATPDRPKQLIEYKDRILVHSANKLSYDTGLLDADTRAIFKNFDGLYLETDPGLRIKSIEANKNLYFTSSDGIKKISAKTADDLSTSTGFIQNAGAIKALDIEAELQVQQGQLSGFLPADSTVAYRALWGYKDTNDNLLLGTPSNRFPVYNYLSDILALDLNGLTTVLDKLNTPSGSMINNGNYANTYYSPVSSSVFSIQTKVIALAKQLDKDILFASSAGGPTLTISTIGLSLNTVTITFTGGNVTEYFLTNDYIDLQDLTSSTTTTTTLPDLKGSHLIDGAITATTISFTYVHGNISPETPLTVNLYSYNYRHITGTGSNSQALPVSTQTLSTPATNGQELVIQDAIRRISNRLRVEPIGVISASLKTKYITDFLLTSAANTKLTITIPKDITSDYFVQVYRTRLFQATEGQTLGSLGGLSVEADDEMRLVYEAFPSVSELSLGELVFVDKTPDSLVQNNTNLYTNPETGEGILAANEPPPFAKDINRFKNVTFYANTRTKHRIPKFQLYGIEKIVPYSKITFTNGINTDTYSFVKGVQEKTSITFTAANGTIPIVSGKYYILYSAMNAQKYVFWQRVDGAGIAPVVTLDSIYIAVDILSTDTADIVATKNKSSINTLIFDFSAVETILPTIIVTNILEGKTNPDGSSGNTPFTLVVTTQGDGEDAINKQVLLSSLPSRGQRIAETAQSLVRVINKQANSPVVAYYTSGDATPPGQITLEAKTLTSEAFYILGSNADIGVSFNPDISPDNNNITSVTAGLEAILTFSTPHGFKNGDKIVITGSTSTPSIDGLRTVTTLTPLTLSIPVTVTTGVTGVNIAWSRSTNTTISSNETKPNRIYYSKLNQPESVPLLNFFDISAEDKQILRIVPLRDSLFVFKQDGTYRISGQLAPFITSLLDSSSIVAAPDSVAISNNVIYAWTTKGITPINEYGASAETSRPIDTEILRLSSASFPNFSKLTWGIGYDSDNSYTVYTNSDVEDTVATMAFRYCTLTNTWTNITRAQTCGVIATDQLYMGNGNKNSIDKERKDLLRSDYADDDFQINLQVSSLATPVNIQFTSVANIEVGDVLGQVQNLSAYQFNSLLDQLDFDPSLQKDYAATLSVTPGTNIRNNLVSLAAKLDLDPGTTFKDYSTRIASISFTTTGNLAGNPTVVSTSVPHGLVPGRLVTISGTDNSIATIVGTYVISNPTTSTFNLPITVIVAGTNSLNGHTENDSFQDILACFNTIITRLNADIKVTFSTYSIVVDKTLFEAVITSVDYMKNRVTVNVPLQWLVGPMTVYKAINCEWTYTPCVMGDALSTKQMFDASIMFRDRAITGFVANFSSDLFPEFISVPFKGHGNGIFGIYSEQGFGYSNFGGQSHSAPFRTYIPKNAQRCRYINLQITHKVAREEIVLYGVTLTGNTGISFRGYR